MDFCREDDKVVPSGTGVCECPECKRMLSFQRENQMVLTVVCVCGKRILAVAERGREGLFKAEKEEVVVERKMREDKEEYLPQPICNNSVLGTDLLVCCVLCHRLCRAGTSIVTLQCYHTLHEECAKTW